MNLLDRLKPMRLLNINYWDMLFRKKKKMNNKQMAQLSQAQIALATNSSSAQGNYILPNLGAYSTQTGQYGSTYYPDNAYLIQEIKNRGLIDSKVFDEMILSYKIEKLKEQERKVQQEIADLIAQKLKA